MIMALITFMLTPAFADGIKRERVKFEIRGQRDHAQGPDQGL